MTGKFRLFMNNRLYCTFTTIDAYEEVANTIQTSYVILFNKIFVLENLDGDKIMLTYNVDMNNSSTSGIIDNTILVHRKKQTKLVLYIYDAFIFDVSKLDGKQTLIDLQNILSDKFPIKLKIGKHYGALS